MDFGVQVVLGKHIETMPLHSPGVLYFGVQTGGDNFWAKVWAGLRVQHKTGMGGSCFRVEGWVGLRVQGRGGQGQRPGEYLWNLGCRFTDLDSRCRAEGMDKEAGIGLI